LRVDRPVLLTLITWLPSDGIEMHEAGSSRSRTIVSSPGALTKSGLLASLMTFV